MHKFTTSTAEERKAHRAELEVTLDSMVGTNIFSFSSASRVGFHFQAFNVTLESNGIFGYTVVLFDDTNSDKQASASFSFQVKDVQDA